MAFDSSPNQARPPRLVPYRSHRAAPTGVILLALALGVLLLAGLFFLLTQKTVALDIDGQVVTFRTHQSTVGAALDEIGLSLAPQDTLSPGQDDPLENGAVIRVRRAQAVLVEADGRLIELQSLQRVPLALLSEAGVPLGRYDLVIVDGVIAWDPTQLIDQAPAYVQVVRAVSVTIDDDGQLIPIFTTEATIGGALHAAGLTLYLADQITPDVSAPITDGLTITIRRSQPVTVTTAETTVRTRTLADTVGAALAETGLALVGEDYSIPPPEAPLPPDGLIRVVRVREDLLIERGEIPYATLYRPDETMALDELRVLRPGTAGIQERRTRIRYEDEVEVSQVVEPLRIAQPSQDEIVAYGTQIVIRTLETPGGPLAYWRVIRMLATSYSPATSSKPPDAPSYGLSGTGIPVARGIVAVDPDVIPYFTRVYVAGYGEGLAADSGGAINGRRIDLGYGDDDLELWYSWVDVYLLTPVPPAEDILYVLP